MESFLFKSIFIIITFAILSYGGLLFLQKPFCGKLASWLLLMALCSDSLLVITRWINKGHPPFANLYESLLFFVWSIIAVYLFVEYTLKNRHIGFFISTFVLLIWIFASYLDTSIQPLLPSLKSNWIAIHVITYFVGYGAVTVSFISSVSLLFVWGRKNTGGVAPVLDQISFRSILYGFPFLTTGLLTGSVWAHQAWGNYWGWDPKEIGSLLTWLIYAVYIHIRKLLRWEGRRAAWVSIAGFILVLFTFIGINFFSEGLHSYL